MIKKLLFLIITSSISFNFSWAQIVPLKKPSLSSEELNKKIIGAMSETENRENVIILFKLKP